MKGLITFWLIIILGYFWALIQFITAQPFDAMVLFIVTYGFHVFRNAILKEISELNDSNKGEV